MQRGEDPFFKIDEVLALRSSLNDETDRGCALMAAAYLSNQLEGLLRSLFVDDQKNVNRLFEPSGPAGSFSARLDLAYACGLLAKSTCDDLHMIRKIRNEFGHVSEPLTFEEQAIADRCQALHNVFDVKAKSRAKFTTAAMAVCAEIHTATYETSHRAVPRDLVWDEERKSRIRDRVNKVATEIMERLDTSDNTHARAEELENETGQPGNPARK